MSYRLHDKLDIMEHDDNTTFVTTAIDYPNALPHIGTAFEKIGADVYARFRRFQGREVYFLMGNDENTSKIISAAEASFLNGELPPGGSRVLTTADYKKYVDKMAESFKKVWQQLNISYDDFIQTSEERHKRGVQHLLNVVNAAGYIQKRKYKGWYCPGCEEFKTPGVKFAGSTLPDNTCPYHPNAELVEREEENYFFLLSKFQQWVSDILYLTPFTSMYLSIEPDTRKNEIDNFVASGLQDISISRRNEGWGIPIPWDESQVTYVWFDALLNYLTAIGFGTDWEKFEKFWPAEVHFVGKDITRFHAALFPAMLEAYNRGCKILHEENRLKAFPVRVFSHGFIYQKKGDQIVKSSKSGNAVNPVELIEQFGADAYRYYFLARCDYSSDGTFSLEHFKETYNADLANGIGNLVSRLHSMVNKYCDGVAKPSDSFEGRFPSFWMTPETLDVYESRIIENCSFHQALDLVRDIVWRVSQYLDQMKPWDASNSLQPQLSNSASNTLYVGISSLRIIALLLKPFTPTAAEKIYNAFEWPVPWDETSWHGLELIVRDNWIGIEDGIKAKGDKFDPLFPRAK